MANPLILVNEQNRALGRAEKSTVHQAGLLHRAFSIFLVDQAGQILLQQRHPAKYHSGGLWANSCCGHPHRGEQTVRAARRRLGEELGAACSLRFGFLARYSTTFPDGLKENEIVYVYFGLVPEGIAPSHSEISALELSSLAELRRDIQKNPDAYAYWLKYYIDHHFQEIEDGIDRVLQRSRELHSPSSTTADPWPGTRSKRSRKHALEISWGGESRAGL